MGMFSVKSTGFAPADTLKRTPHGRFLTWLTNADKQKSNVQRNTNNTIFDNSDRNTARHVTKFSYVNDRYIYSENSSEQKNVRQKSVIQKIKDWWNKDKVNVNEAENEALLKKVTIDEDEDKSKDINFSL